jgi:MoaA/NifB/PqqE/SkfB family radical SAM enzyme
MDAVDLLRTWGRILSGRRPALSLEITRECPLRCPGCYAYEDGHVGDGMNLRQLADKKGDALVQGVLEIVEQYRPLHVSLVGGDPMVRFRELETLLPALSARGVHVQLVTSAFREIPKAWAAIRRLSIVVSIDGLQPEHDARRKPATYERILKNIQDHRITVHCTITAQMMRRSGYLAEFLEFWTKRGEIRRVWMSFFTPQMGASGEEILSPQQRAQAVSELLRLRELFPKLDMPVAVAREFLHPPLSPEQCIFAQTLLAISADLKTRITPCQFGGDPDCSQCGCYASMGLASAGHRRLAPGITAGHIFSASMRVGKMLRKFSATRAPKPAGAQPLTRIPFEKSAVATASDAVAASAETKGSSPAA